MKRKKEYLILAVVIVGLTLYLVGRSNDQGGFDLPRLHPVENAKVDRLVVARQGQDPIEVIRKDDKWYLQPKGYVADGTKVRNMLKAAEDLTITALAAESGNYERYDLGADKKLNVKLYAGQDLVREFDIGKAAPTYQHTFVKLPGDGNVYHAKGTIHYTFDNTQDSLRDKTVLAFDKGSVSSLEIRKGDKDLVINKKTLATEAPKAGSPAPEEKKAEEKKTEESKSSAAGAAAPKTEWQSPDGKAVDQAAVDQLINAMSSLQCDSYLADDAGDKLVDDQWRLTFKTDKDESYTLKVFAKEAKDEKVPALSSTGKYAFLLSKVRVDTFEKQIGSLLNPVNPQAKK